MSGKKGQKHYSEEFKEEALRKIREGEIGVREFSREYGVSLYAIKSWRRQEKNPELKKTKEKMSTELEKLQQENKQLKMENILLKSFHQAITREEQKRNFRL